MLRPAVLLDATMTVAEARVRLAQHGYWTSLDDPGARAVLQAHVNRIAAAIARRAATAARVASGAVPLRET